MDERPPRDNRLIRLEDDPRELVRQYRDLKTEVEELTRRVETFRDPSGQVAKEGEGILQALSYNTDKFKKIQEKLGAEKVAKIEVDPFYEG